MLRKVWVPKGIARRPAARTETYLKFGFVIMKHENHYCPRCSHVLNAGPNYQPKYCDQCGQKINFSSTEWREDRQLGYAERSNEHESVKN